MRLQLLEQTASARLALPLIITHSEPGAAIKLNASEEARFTALKHGFRKRNWLLGRNALKQLLTALSRPADTTAVSFPDRQLSLTHGGDVALAAGTPIPASGIGIDFEPAREIRPDMARWFLNDQEMGRLEGAGERDSAASLLRLWTMKEAAFKSYPQNSGMLLRDFTVVDPDAAATEVFAAGDERTIRVFSCSYLSGYASIAVLL